MLPDPIFLNVHMYGIMISLGIIGAFISLYLFGVSIWITDSVFTVIYVIKEHIAL